MANMSDLLDGNFIKLIILNTTFLIVLLRAVFFRFSKDREMLERFINTQSTYMQLDETGRIVLSNRLKEKIGIKDEAIFAGMGEKFQIWEPKNYQDEVDALNSSFKNLPEDENPFLKLDQLQD